MATPLEILEANDRADVGTFLYGLHEEERFDEPAFWVYLNAILGLARSTKSGDIEREVARRIVRTSQYVLRSLVWHFLPDDQSRINDLDVARVSAFMDRLTTTVDGYFAGYALDESTYRDGLKNPER